MFRRGSGPSASIRQGSLTIARLLPRADLPRTLLLGLLLLLSVLLFLGFIVATGVLVGSIPAAVRDGLESPSGRRTIWALVAVAAAFTGQQVIGPFRQAVAENLGRRLDGHLRERVMAATLSPPGIAHLEDPDLLDQVSMAQGVGTGQMTPGDAVMGFANNMASHLQAWGSAVIVAVLLHPVIAVLLITCSLLVRRRLLDEGGKRIQVLMGQARSMRRSGYFRDLAITPGAAKETRVFGLGGWVLDRFTGHWTDAMSVLWAERRAGRRVPFLWFTPTALTTFAGFWFAANASLDGDLPLASLAMLAQAILSAGTWFVTDNDIYLQHGAASVGPALELEKSAAALGLPGDRDPSGLPEREIRFEDVAFRYPGRDEDVFTGLNLTIPAGRSLAIVGSNGAGKTTLVKLLARLYDPQSGRITADGIDLRELDPRAWQHRLAAIFQDFVRFELPASANVGFGGVALAGDRAALEEAATRAGALDVINALPHGWDTILSREYTGGAEPSGGQWQRIALARALLSVRAGAGVLVLDEPTANLDVRAEAELFDRFLELTRGLTTILISHRFSSVRHAERICVLESGRIVEEGTHDELMARAGRYAEMFNLQASRFTEDEQAEVPGGPGAHA